MRRAIFFILLVIAVSTGRHATAEVNRSMLLCNDYWPNNHVLRKECLLEQGRSARRILRFAKRHGIKLNNKARNYNDPYVKMLNTCISQWELERLKTFDYAMVDLCVKHKLKAYRSLQRARRSKAKRDPPGDRLEDKLGPFE